jgi:hypothetical protein
MSENLLKARKRYFEVRPGRIIKRWKLETWAIYLILTAMCNDRFGHLLVYSLGRSPVGSLVILTVSLLLMFVNITA